MKLLTDAVQTCDYVETPAEWVTRGLKFLFAEQSVGEVIYIPMGYLVLEVTPTEVMIWIRTP